LREWDLLRDLLGLRWRRRRRRRRR